MGIPRNVIPFPKDLVWQCPDCQTIGEPMVWKNSDGEIVRRWCPECFLAWVGENVPEMTQVIESVKEREN